METPENMKTIYLAGGCFWGMQKFFDQFDGVIRTEVGYANGPDEAPSYQDVCRSSGHAETVRVDYDPGVISLADLLNYYFMVIDPLSVNKQGNDRGIQYRTGVYYTDEAQLPAIRAVFAREREKAGAPLAVALEPLRELGSDLKSETIVLSHFSMKHTPAQILRFAAEQVPEELRDRIKLLI